jgi:pyruvate dehydrogenase E1 component beta subunit
VPIGKAALRREGTDATLITWSRMYYFVEEAARLLEKEGISVDLLDLRSLRPFDEEAILASVQKTNRAVVVEEGWPSGGFGAQIVDTIQSKAFDFLDAPVLRVTGLDVPMSYANNLELAITPDAARIVQAVKQTLYRKEN